MLRRLKKDHTNSMELPVKEIYVDRQFFSEVENDFAQSIMGGAQRNFDTYVAQGVMLNNCKQNTGVLRSRYRPWRGGWGLFLSSQSVTDCFSLKTPIFSVSLCK